MFHIIKLVVAKYVCGKNFSFLFVGLLTAMTTFASSESIMFKTTVLKCFSYIMIFNLLHCHIIIRVKLIIEEMERDEAALQDDLYSADRKFAEYYNVWECIIDVHVLAVSYLMHLFVRIFDVKPLLDKPGLRADTGSAY